jgi:hypothetical protein
MHSAEGMLVRRSPALYKNSYGRSSITVPMLLTGQSQRHEGNGTGSTTWSVLALHRLHHRTVSIEIDPRETGTRRLSFISIRSSEDFRFYQAFHAIIFAAVEQ